MLACEILRSEAEIEAIADEWRQLDARARRTPVTDYDRFFVWWRTVGKTEGGVVSLHVVIGRSAGKLVAVLPLVVIRRRWLLRMLHVPGGMTFESDTLCENPRFAAELWQVARKSPHYDFAKIKNVFTESAGYEPLRSFARVREVVESFFLHINWASSADWLASLSGNARGNFRRCSRRLEEKGALKYEVYKGGPLPTAVIDGMVKHKMAWGASRGKQGLFEQPHVGLYFQQLAETAAAQGTLFMAWLKCGDDVIGYNFGLIDQGVLYAHFWTYDPAWSQYSPGNVIMIHTICWAIDNGLKGLDFMCTREGESEKYFKRKYCNDIRNCYEFTFSGSFFGRVVEDGFVLIRDIKRKIVALIPARGKKAAASSSSGENEK